MAGSSVTGPDGGTTAYEFVQATTYWGGQNPYGGVIGKVTRPDGSVEGKMWAANPPAMDEGVCTVAGIPQACNLNEGSNRRNQYVSWEYETAVSAAGAPVRVKTREYEVDQNGNQLKVKERDWSAWGASAPASAEVGTLVRTK